MTHNPIDEARSLDAIIRGAGLAIRYPLMQESDGRFRLDNLYDRRTGLRYGDVIGTYDDLLNLLMALGERKGV